MIIPTQSFIVAKSIWISDIHLGSCGTQLYKLQHFLMNISCETLFLNGDILDKWLVKNISCITPDQRNIIDQLNILKTKGTQLVFLSGNHDKKEDILHLF